MFDSRRYGGEVKQDDFNMEYKSLVTVAEEMLEDMKFDLICKNNIEEREKEKEF